MIRFVTLDLWETLIADSPRLDALRTEYRIRKTLDKLEDVYPGVDYNIVSKAHEATWQSCASYWDAAHDVSFEQQVRLFLNLIQEGLADRIDTPRFEAIAHSYATAVLKHPPRLIEGVPQALKAMVGQGFSLGLICNTGRSPGKALRTLLDELGISGFFSAKLFSDETIVRKPDPAIFRLALAALGAQKDSTVHVGDSWNNDVEGANSAGLWAVWVSSCGPPKPGCQVIETIASLPQLLNRM